MAGVCSDCFSGHLHEGTPTGTVTTIHGIPTYISQPDTNTKPKGLIVIISDAFGWTTPNTRLLADNYAKNGDFLVYTPDFMNNSAMTFKTMARIEAIKAPTSWFATLFYKPIWIAQTAYDALTWLFKTRTAVCKSRIENFIRDIRISPPPFDTQHFKISVAGFCWGGRHAFLLAADSPSSRVQRYGSDGGVESLVDCAFAAHPSMLAFPREVEDVRLPISVSVGEEDMMLSRKQVREMKEILEVKNKGDHEVVTIKGAKHGFAVRADLKDEFMLECAQKAEKQAVEWFTRWLV